MVGQSQAVGFSVSWDCHEGAQLVSEKKERKRGVPGGAKGPAFCSTWANP